MIEKIYGLNGMKNLRVLSLSRNYIKQVTGLVCRSVTFSLKGIRMQIFFQEAVADTLVELWISYNLVEKLKGLAVLKNLKILYISNNLLKDWMEFNRLQELESLQEVVLVGNPLCEGFDEASWRLECIKRLPLITKLDGEPIVVNEEPHQ